MVNALTVKKPSLQFTSGTRTFWSLSPTPVLVFLVAAILYFSPYLTFDKILVGTDDGPRGWHTYGNLGHAIESHADKWSPLNGGTAIMERQFGRFLNPTYVLHLIFPKYKQRVFEYIFWTFVAGFSMFCYLRTIGLSRSTAMIFGLSFMVTPAFQSYVYAGHYARMQVVALLPGIMTLTERMLRKASPIDMLALPLLLAWCIYSEHLQLAYFSFLGMGAYFIIRMIYALATKRVTLAGAGKRAGYFGAALIIGCLITSMSTFPSIHHTYTISERTGGVDYTFASSFSLHPEEMISLIEPDFIGWKEGYWGQNPLKLNSEYFSGPILIMAVFVFFLRRPGFMQYLFGAFFLVALLFALGGHTPVHRIFYDLLPGMNVFRGPSMMHIWMFFPAYVLAAMGLETLSQKIGEPDVAVKRRLYILSGVFAVMALLYTLFSDVFAQFWFDTVLPVEFRTPSNELALNGNMKAIETGGGVVFIVLIAFLYSTYRKINGKIKPGTYLMLFLSLILIDQIRVSRPFLTQCAKPLNYFSRQEAWEQSIGTYLNQKDPTLYRVHAMFGDPKMYIPGLDLTYVFDDFTNHRYNDLIRVLNVTAAAILQQPSDNVILNNRFRNLLNHLNAKYVLSVFDLNVPGLEKVHSSGPLKFYQNVDVLPRVYLASQIIKTDNPKRTLLNLLERNEGLKNKAIVKDNTHAFKELDATADGSDSDSVSITEYDDRRGRILLDINSRREQIVIVAGNDTNGWKAFVNGRETDVMPVNYTWKGILIPEGTLQVAFVYDSPVANLWRRVTMVTAVIYALLTLSLVLRKLKTRKSR